MLAVMGPLLWAWVACDLAGLALGTDYARLVRCVIAVGSGAGHGAPGNAALPGGEQQHRLRLARCTCTWLSWLQVSLTLPMARRTGLQVLHVQVRVLRTYGRRVWIRLSSSQICDQVRMWTSRVCGPSAHGVDGQA